MMLVLNDEVEKASRQSQRASLDPDAAAELDRLRLAAWASEDGAEARAAFVEKRKPRFTGK